MAEFTVFTSETMVNVFISSNCNSFTSEKKFAKDLTIADLKSKLELITGGSALSMLIDVFDKDDKKVCSLDDANALLGSYPVDSGMRLHVEDTTRDKGEFENLANVEKFELSKDEYSKRTNTVQSFLRQNNLGKYNQEEMERIRKEKKEAEQEEEEMAKAMKVGDRCQVDPSPGHLARRGLVQYVGKVHFQKGIWVGVQFDEPSGKNDGSVDGKRYFTCPDKYGGFVRVNYVKVGDYPEEELDLSDEDEM